MADQPSVTKGYTARPGGGPTVPRKDATPSVNSRGAFLRTSAGKRGMGRSHQGRR
jgi:hypothetical protein